MSKSVLHAVSTLNPYRPSGWYWLLGLKQHVIQILPWIILYLISVMNEWMELKVKNKGNCIRIMNSENILKIKCFCIKCECIKYIYIYIHVYIYIWKLNQTVLELDFRAVKFLFFPRRDLNPHHCYTAAPFA